MQLIEAVYVAGFKFEIKLESARESDIVIEKNTDLIRHHMRILAKILNQLALDEEAKNKNRNLEF